VVGGGRVQLPGAVTELDTSLTDVKVADLQKRKVSEVLMLRLKSGVNWTYHSPAMLDMSPLGAKTNTPLSSRYA
jgi:putative NADH-flavin reductase